MQATWLRRCLLAPRRRAERGHCPGTACRCPAPVIRVPRHPAGGADGKLRRRHGNPFGKCVGARREQPLARSPAAVSQQRDDRPGDSGERGGQISESLNAVDVAQLGGDPAAEQCAGDADDAGEDEALQGRRDRNQLDSPGATATLAARIGQAPTAARLRRRGALVSVSRFHSCLIGFRTEC